MFRRAEQLRKQRNSSDEKIFMSSLELLIVSYLSLEKALRKNVEEILDENEVNYSASLVEVPKEVFDGIKDLNLLDGIRAIRNSLGKVSDVQEVQSE